jgi:hypothetical protein
MNAKAMGRRDFVFLGAGAMAASALGGINVYDERREAPSNLNLTELEIDVGVRHAFKVFHFSDTHLNFFDIEDYASVADVKKERYHRRWGRFPQALTSFCASVEYALMRRMPMLHTGDLLDFTNGGNERVLRRNIAGLDIHFAIGNHEYQNAAFTVDRGKCAEMRRRLGAYFKGNDLKVSSRVLGGVNFVAFDNSLGNLEPDTVERVKLEFGKPMPVVLMCHVPPVYTEAFRENSRKASLKIRRAMGERGLSLEDIPLPGNPADRYDEGTRGFYGWLAERRELKAILCGHTHWAEVDDFSPTAKMYVAGGNYEGCANEIVIK